MQRRWPTCPGITPRWAGCHLHAYRITILRTTHPRVGEENYASRRTAGSPYGSSPRGRGKRQFLGNVACVDRLIPARAGKTSHGPDHRLASTAHPRAGGENADRAIARAIAPRLIPAWAGKTERGIFGLAYRQAHPRMGGENTRDAAGIPWLKGSSPRGLGKLLPAREAVQLAGLIPAWTGKTVKVSVVAETKKAHPRAGGENESAPGRSVWLMGSSPRGRGKHVHAFFQHVKSWVLWRLV